MNEFDPDRFETELQGLKPAKPPRELLDRVLAELSESPEPEHSRRSSAWARLEWWNLLRWLAPVAGVAAVAAILVFEYRNHSPKAPGIARLVSSSNTPLKADKVEIDRQLLADFDAVGRLPSGEPVRFHCHQWMDQVRLRDSASGLMIERRTPRLEIVPVSFETY